MSGLRFSDICKKEVKAKAAGMWDRIIGSLAPSISPALDHPGLVHIDCPMHGGAGDFRVYRDVVDSGGGVCTCGNWPDGIALIGAVNDWTFKDSLSEIGRLVLGEKPELQPVHREVRRRDTAREDAAIRHRLVALWSGGISMRSADARAAWMYLVGRGLKIPRNLQSVRFHPSMAYYEKGVLVGHFPGLMACVMAPDGSPVTIHRTFLTNDGRKAPVESPKKLCPHASTRPLQGSAIRLFPVADHLAVAEGIETSLAVTEMFGVPCWATVTAGLMAQFVPPPGIKRVTIYADKDSPSKFHPKGHGQEAATMLAERLWKSGIQAGVELPPIDIPEGKKGIDWLDIHVGVSALQKAAA